MNVKRVGKQLSAGLGALVLLGLLGGCVADRVQRDPSYAAVRPVAVPTPAPGTGAIYQAGYDMRLYEDRKARRVGDILTIQLVEKIDASKSASTTATKETSATIANPTVLGSTPQFNTPGFLPLASNKNNTLATSLDSANDFSGEGESKQSNTLSGSISVTVVEVLPNGNLVVRGEKIISINQGDEFVRIMGVVRPEDVGADNTVVSTQVADAHISYGGTGVVADANKMGWLARFFVSAIWPF